jgi:2-polyprenyl-3-methyl-5-hydroxy-6-metoxy-1,4-benzoquinol methylase
MIGRVRRLLRELGRAPALAAVEAAQARAFAEPSWLEPYARAEYVESGLTDTESALIGRWLRPGDRLLDVGCGSGREALGFARAGLVVTAVDSCAAAVARAPAHPGVTYRVATLRALDLAPRSFDAVFLSSDVYGTVPLARNRIAALEALKRLVRPGGLVTFPPRIVTPTLARRFLLDGPHRVVAALVPGRAELGDRFDAPPGYAYRHVFASLDEVRREVEAAGLAFEPGSPFVAGRRPPDAGPDGRRFRRVPDVLTEAAGADLLLVHAGRGTTFQLNRTGRAIYQLAGEGATSTEVAARLHAELGVDAARLEQDARELMDELARAGLLEPAP